MKLFVLAHLLLFSTLYLDAMNLQEHEEDHTLASQTDEHAGFIYNAAALIAFCKDSNDKEEIKKSFSTISNESIIIEANSKVKSKLLEEIVERLTRLKKNIPCNEAAQIIRQLVEHNGLSANFLIKKIHKDKTYWMPLLYRAAQICDEELVGWLLDNNVDINIIIRKNRKISFAFALKNSPRLALEILRKWKIDFRTNRVYTIRTGNLFWSPSNDEKIRYRELLTLMVEQGLNPNYYFRDAKVRSESHYLLLYLVFECEKFDQPKLFEILLQKGANPYLPYEYNQTKNKTEKGFQFARALENNLNWDTALNDDKSFDDAIAYQQAAIDLIKKYTPVSE
jgi:hypothetical protein